MDLLSSVVPDTQFARDNPEADHEWSWVVLDSLLPKYHVRTLPYTFYYSDDWLSMTGYGSRSPYILLCRSRQQSYT